MAELSSEHAEALARGLVDAVPAAVVHVRCDGTIVAANAEASRLLGITAEQLNRIRITDLPPLVREDGSPLPFHEYPALRVLETGLAQPVVTLGVRRAGGETTWLVARALPIHDHNGQLLGAFVTWVDISERKRAEDALQRSRELLRKSQELARVGSWEWDFAADRLCWTDLMFEIHGVDPAGFSGTLAEALAPIHPDDREVINRKMHELFMHGTPVSNLDYRIVRPDGGERSVSASGELVRDSSGRPVKAIGAVQDITERQQLEVQLHQMQRLESIGQLAGGIAHDFNNLLQPIFINADLLLRGKAVEAPVREIKLAARRGADLTQRLLAFGQRQTFRQTPLDLNRVIEPFVELLRRTLGERISVELSLSEPLGAVLGDAAQLEQVIMNLAVNARDAMPNGGQLQIRTREIAVSERNDLQQLRPDWSGKRCVELVVSDSGLGMNPDVQARAFEPFYTTKPLGSGTGLGLAVVYGIVHEHRGTVQLDSRIGAGTSFRIYLPVTPRAVESGAPAAVSGRVGQGHRELLLLVEDDAAIRRSTLHLLESANYRVLVASDTESALRLFHAHADQIDLVLTDVVMPDGSGPQLVNEIRWRRPQTRVLFMTGYAADQLGSLADPVLTKPYGMDELLAALRSALETASPTASLVEMPAET